MSSQDLKHQTQQYLTDNVPQIQQHGGSVEIKDVDMDSGRVTVAIGGACSGCGIAPMTMNAIESRLPENVDGVEGVNVVRADGTDTAVMPSKTDEMSEMTEYENYNPPF
ncbi:NifU family protein [Halovenus rubra]|uniref:NifU family protein n=2 Tax=Halovenus rubra TaxID=869890 RepID=A0ABD5X1A4_9EURY|nr:NifU family protein [Halovenus rubra]